MPRTFVLGLFFFKKIYILDFKDLYLVNARPDSPAAKKPHTLVVIKRDENEFRIPLMGILGLKIKRGE